MPRSPATALLLLALAGSAAEAQILDDTLVPRGQLRLQAQPVFITWDTRFGRDASGVTGRERLDSDLTDPTGHLLFPGITDLTNYLVDITGESDYAPTLGASQALLSQEVTRLEFGGHLGVTDWLTVGVIFPWVQTRTTLDFTFVADTTAGSSLGLTPLLSNFGGVNAYLADLTAAAAAAQANATAVCAGGGGASCTAAQALASRASGLQASTQGAYGAAPFFPTSGSAMATSLALVSSSLDADLQAAGLPGISQPMIFSTEPVTADNIDAVSTFQGGGIEGSPLASRKGLWHAGDVELTALVRLLERGPSSEDAGSSGGVGYSVRAGFLMRLPTGVPEDPDFFLDVGTGDGQTDLEGRIAAAIAVGPFALAAGGRYGMQRSTTLTRRVAPLEVALPPLSTRQSVRWSPDPYMSFELAPTIRVTGELTLMGEYRYYQKGRDRFELLEPSVSLDPEVLARESGVKLHQIGGGLRYTTVRPWRDGVANRPLEIHVRLLHSVAGGGGHTPVATRVEAGLRLFRRFWGR